MSLTRTDICKLALAGSLATALSGCKIEESFSGILGTSRSQQWEYRVIYFDRDSYSDFDKELQAAGDEGWQYAGPLCNDGVNAQFVAFKRPK